MLKNQEQELVDVAEVLHGTSDFSAFNRRAFLGGTAAAAATTALTSNGFAQGFPVGPIADRYPYPVWKVLDDRFKKYVSGNTPLRREWTGSLWAEGSAWNGVGRYVVFSDIPNNRQMRWDEVTGEVTLLRMPSNFSNGNTFDFAGPADLVRALDRARRPLRVGRRAHGPRRQLRGQAAQRAERRGRPSG